MLVNGAVVDAHAPFVVFMDHNDVAGKEGNAAGDDTKLYELFKSSAEDVCDLIIKPAWGMWFEQSIWLDVEEEFGQVGAVGV